MSDTLLLRALAALLIANSHIEAFYPVRQLAADGLLGDSLFFFLSGYGLALSARKSQRGFLEWYGRRLSRIYPALLLVVFAFAYVPQAGWMTWTPSDYLLNFGWGRAYPFVGQILVFYVGFYVLSRVRRPEWYLWTFLSFFCLYVVLPALGRGKDNEIFHAFHWLFYFQTMLLGAWIAERPSLAKPGGMRDLALLLGLGVVYVAVRVGVGVAAGPLRDWYFLPHLLVLPIIVLLLRIARSPFVEHALGNWTSLAKVIGFLGGITLEVYLLHYQVLGLEWVRTVIFPLNIVVFFTLSLLSAGLLSWTIKLLAKIHPVTRIFWRGSSGIPGGWLFWTENDRWTIADDQFVQLNRPSAIGHPGGRLPGTPEEPLSFGIRSRRSRIQNLPGRNGDRK